MLDKPKRRKIKSQLPLENSFQIIDFSESRMIRMIYIELVPLNKIEMIYDVLRDFVPFAQYKKRDKHPWKNVTSTNITKNHAQHLIFQ